MGQGEGRGESHSYIVLDPMLGLQPEALGGASAGVGSFSRPRPAERAMDRSNDWTYIDEGGWTVGLPNPAATSPGSGSPTPWVLSGSCQPGAATSQGLPLPEFGE